MITTQKSARRCRRASLAGVPVLLLLAACAGPQSSETSASEPETSAAVETAAVTRGPVEETLETYGTVEVDPTRVQTVPLIEAGQVLEVRVAEGEAVREGDALLTLGPVPAGSVEVQKARIEVDYAEREVARTRALLEQKLATNQDLENAQKQLDTARAALRGLGGGVAGESKTLTAPGPGVVTQVLVTRGQVVAPGEAALQLAALDPLLVRAGFEAEELARLREGLEAWLEPVFVGGDEKPARAVLARLQRTVDPATQLVEGFLQVANPPAWVAPGMRLRVSVVVHTAAEVVRVPREALLEREGQAGVFVVVEGHARWRPVALGVQGDRLLEVREGLTGGESVVTAGRSSLSDGMAVRVEHGSATP